MYGTERVARVLIWAPLLLFCFLSGGCNIGSPSKSLHYYSLEPGDESDPDGRSTVSGGGVGVRVEPFEVPEIYRDPAIIWRDRRHLRQFQFNRWASAPSEMLRRYVAEMLRRNTEDPVSWISTSDHHHPDAQFFVRGSIRDIYLTRVEGTDSWKGVVRVRINLLKAPSRPASKAVGGATDARTFLGSWVLSGTGTVDAPAGEPGTPEAMNRLLDRLTENLKANGRAVSRKIQKKVEEVFRKANREQTDRAEEK